VSAILIFTLTGLQAQRWRGATLIGYSLLGALLTDVIAGPLIGAYAGDKFWALLPCLWLVTIVAALLGAALLAALPALVAILVLAIVFIVVGLVTAGGVALLPTYWQAIGAVLPQRYGTTLIQNVLYFSSNNITTPIVELLVYALIAVAVLTYVEWIRPRRAHAPATQAGESGAGGKAGSRPGRVVIAVLVVSAQAVLRRCERRPLLPGFWTAIGPYLPPAQRVHPDAKLGLLRRQWNRAGTDHPARLPGRLRRHARHPRLVPSVRPGGPRRHTRDRSRDHSRVDPRGRHRMTSGYR
jgi:hypothetical protein